MIISLRDHRQPLRSPLQAAEQFYRWATVAAQTAELAMQSGDVPAAVGRYRLAATYRRKANILIGKVEDAEEQMIEQQLQVIEELYRSAT